MPSDAWQASQGNTAEVGVGAIQGLGIIDNEPTMGDKMVSLNSLQAADVPQDVAKAKFYDLSSHGRGVITNVRTGQLKKDISLLFELTTMPTPYSFNPLSDIREPSIRPMTPELAAKLPKITSRHFASWTNMRHFYRMYRSSSDATIGEMGGHGSLAWNRSQPVTDCSASTSLGGGGWNGSNNYWRMPILAKITFIYSLVSEPNSKQPGKFDCFHVYSPVFTLWNPYNTEMRVPSGKLQYQTSAYKVWPNSGEFWLGSKRTRSADVMGIDQFGYNRSIRVNTESILQSGPSGGDIVFRPGEFRIFSHASMITKEAESIAVPLVPGFNPQAVAGEKKLHGTYSPEENPGIKIQFSHNYGGSNINYGNTAGSLCMLGWWNRSVNAGGVPINYAHDWFNKSQRATPISLPSDNDVIRWSLVDSMPLPVAFSQLVIKGASHYNYETINWARDWRSKNWIQAPPFYFGSGMYISEIPSSADTQRMDNPYMVFFGPTRMLDLGKVVGLGQSGTQSLLGSGTNPFEKITSASLLELPTAPISSLMGFAGMRINPGWVAADRLASHLSSKIYGTGSPSGQESLHAAETKRVAYQSGVTGTGIGNSFMHPQLRRDDVYTYFDNSKSQDIPNRGQPDFTIENDTQAYCDFWDHALLLNDALFDEFFVSSLSNQTRNNAGSALDLSENIARLTSGQPISNSRYQCNNGGKTAQAINTELLADDGFLRAAKYMTIDGVFNVNSTSVDAWHALFSGIRQRQLVFRGNGGALHTVQIPSDKRIAISRFDTETSGTEMTSPEFGVAAEGGGRAWCGLRFLSDAQLRKLAEECVKQVKLRGPFLNFSEFINRRLSNDDLGLMGAIQSAIDYDDASPESGSINFAFKNRPDYMIRSNDVGPTNFQTPRAMEGSRFSGIPGYVIQSDLLKPLSNSLSVRDDTFCIRAYGEALDANGHVTARAWCEAVVQRLPEYCDSTNESHIPARELLPDGSFSSLSSSALTPTNLRFGRKFHIESFRWLNPSDV